MANYKIDMNDGFIERFLDEHLPELKEASIATAPINKFLKEHGLGNLGPANETVRCVMAHFKYVGGRLSDAQLISICVAAKMAGTSDRSICSLALRYLREARGLTVTDQDGYTTSVQAPDPVDPGVPG